MNAILSSGLGKDPDGYCRIFQYNKYTAKNLSVIINDK